MKKYIGFHGTSEIIANKIVADNFLITHTENRLPCDLGNGIYAFKNTERYGNKAKEQAMKYVKKYKNSYKNPTVLEVNFSVDSNRELDMNLPGNQAVFSKFLSENEDEIIKERNNIIKDGAYKRGNFDGLIIELILIHYRKEVDLVIKDSYTSFNDVIGYRESNFYNGRELCIRNIGIIENISII